MVGDLELQIKDRDRELADAIAKSLSLESNNAELSNELHETLQKLEESRNAMALDRDDPNFVGSKDGKETAMGFNIV